MSPPARPLLALAAAALLHAACAGTGSVCPGCDDPRLDSDISSHRRDGDDSEHCTVVRIGSPGLFPVEIHKHIVYKNSIVDTDAPCPDGSHQVGKEIRACDPTGNPPDVKPVDKDGNQARIACNWTGWNRCPQGLDVDVTKYCGNVPPGN